MYWSVGLFSSCFSLRAVTDIYCGTTRQHKCLRLMYATESFYKPSQVISSVVFLLQLPSITCYVYTTLVTEVSQHMNCALQQMCYCFSCMPLIDCWSSRNPNNCDLCRSKCQLVVVYNCIHVCHCFSTFLWHAVLYMALPCSLNAKKFIVHGVYYHRDWL